MTTNIRDVAEKAQVSAATVSRVLRADMRNGFGVSDVTRLRILQAADDLGYRPNIAARAVAGGKTGVIGVVIGPVNASFLEDILAGIQKAAQSRGLAILLHSAEGDNVEETLLDAVRARRMDGCIAAHCALSPRVLAELQERETPVVWLSPELMPGSAAIHVDDERGGFLATTHLLELGHREIAFLGMRLSYDKARCCGYRKAMEERGLETLEWTFDGVDVPFGSATSWRQGEIMAVQLLAQHPRVTGIVCNEDFKALGTLAAARKIGLEVPRDLSVVGYDDLFWMDFTSPPLTSVSQPKEEQGAATFALLMEMLNGKPPREMWLQPELTVRESTAPPRVLAKPRETTKRLSTRTRKSAPLGCAGEKRR